VRARVDDSLFSGLLTGGVFGFSLSLSHSLALSLSHTDTYAHTFRLSLSLYVVTYGTLKIAPGQPLAMAFQNIDLFEFNARNSIPYMRTHRYTRLAETDSDRANDAAGIECSLSHL